jgi:uncharacterized protein YndB with AHSA1/START domain
LHMNTDTIERQVLLKAPVERVWKAISDAKEFGSWFGVRFDGPFVAGEVLKARIVPTTVDPVVAEAQKAYEGVEFEITVEKIEHQSLFSYRWHPNTCENFEDNAKLPPTLVTFFLEETADGVLLTLTESGFDQFPPANRARGLEMNGQGWTGQMTLIQKYLAT